MHDYKERVHAGEYIDAQGKVLGTHQGFVNYTIGQRKGLGIALGQRAFVTHIDARKNQVTLGSYDDLYATELTFRAVKSPVTNHQSPVYARIRYRSQPIEITSLQSPITNQKGSLSFREPVWGITPGQSVVLYQDDLVIGGGFII